MMELATVAITAVWGIGLATAAQLAWGAGRRRGKLSLTRALSDLFVPVAAGTAVFYTLYKVNSGQVRAYVFFGLALGWALHRLLLRWLVAYVATYTSWWFGRAARAARRSARRASRRVRAGVQGFAAPWRTRLSERRCATASEEDGDRSCRSEHTG